MKTTPRFVKALGISGAVLALGGAAHAADCATSSTAVSAAGKASADVVPAVAREIAASSECACDIVTAAIGAVGKENADAVGEIVFVAVSTVPELASQISECAAAAAPDAVDEIKAALRKAFEFQESSKNPMSSGKNPKGVVVEEIVEADVMDDFDRVPVDIRGIYLIPPVSPAGGNAFGDVDQNQIDRLQDEIDRLERKLKNRPSGGGGGSGGGGQRPS